MTCRDAQRLRFDYLTHDGTEQRREVEPHRVVHTGRRWYLVAWDVNRADWRTFRIDRMTPRIPVGPRFTPRDDAPAAGDFVTRGVDTALMRYRARVVAHAPADEVVRSLPSAVAVEPLDSGRCLVHAGGDTPYRLALHILMLDLPFDIVDGPPELFETLAMIARRTRAASHASGTGENLA